MWQLYLTVTKPLIASKLYPKDNQYGLLLYTVWLGETITSTNNQMCIFNIPQITIIKLSTGLQI